MKSLFAIALLCFTNPIVAQKHSLGVSAGIIPKHETEFFIPSFHICYTHKTPHFEKFGLGLALGSHLGAETMYAAGILFDYEVIKNLTLSYSPNWHFSKTHSHGFLSSFEMCYLFNLKAINIGPAFEYSFSNTDQHVTIGVSVSKNW